METVYYFTAQFKVLGDIDKSIIKTKANSYSTCFNCIRMTYNIYVCVCNMGNTSQNIFIKRKKFSTHILYRWNVRWNSIYANTKVFPFANNDAFKCDVNVYVYNNI